MYNHLFSDHMGADGDHDHHAGDGHDHRRRRRGVHDHDHMESAMEKAKGQGLVIWCNSWGWFKQIQCWYLLNANLKRIRCICFMSYWRPYLFDVKLKMKFVQCKIKVEIRAMWTWS